MKLTQAPVSGVKIAPVAPQRAGDRMDRVKAQKVASMIASVIMASSMTAGPAFARYEGVNRPELLPTGEKVTVIDVAGFLTEGEEKRLKSEIASIEADTGVKLRVLAQNYPETPGLAIRDYWSVDDNTVVFVADPTFGNMVNINVGQTVDLSVPQSFWTRLASKYGVKRAYTESGISEAILDTVSAIDTCLREPDGRSKCSKVQGRLGEQPSSGPFGKAFGGK